MEKQTLNQQYDALISAFILHFEKKHGVIHAISESTIAHQFKDSKGYVYFVSLEDLIDDNLPGVKKEYFLEWYKLDQFNTYEGFLKQKEDENKSKL